MIFTHYYVLDSGHLADEQLQAYERQMEGRDKPHEGRDTPMKIGTSQ
jgi:hypothetical protein